MDKNSIVYAGKQIQANDLLLNFFKNSSSEKYYAGGMFQAFIPKEFQTELQMALPPTEMYKFSSGVLRRLTQNCFDYSIMQISTD